MVVKRIVNKEVVLGQSSNQIDLSPVFKDIDEDVLKYTAVSTNVGVASASVSGSQLTLVALSPGTSRIQVSADDGKLGRATTNFILTVLEPPNQAPIVANPISNQSATVGAGNTNIDLSGVFSDADGDILTFSAASSTETVATTSVSGNLLTLSPVSTGTCTITITANDGVNPPVNTTFTMTVNPAPPANTAPTVVATINEQVLTPSVTNARTFDMTQLFEDEDGDPLEFTATSSSIENVTISLNGNELTLSPGNEAGSTTVTVTANDTKGGITSYTFTVRTAPLVTDGMITVHTKQGVRDPLVYDLSTHFPGQTQFMMYIGTPDSTFIGPTPLSGTILPLNLMPVYTWVVGADGKAVVIQTIADQQGASSLYFSQYLDGGDGRKAIQLYYNGGGNEVNATGYELDVYSWNTSTKKMKIDPYSIGSVSSRIPYIIIDFIFYDFFDITNGVYYNDEAELYDSTNNVVAYVLKKNGQIVDVLGDPTSHNQFMPNGGTIIRKSGTWSGSQVFSETGEWNRLPLTFSLIGNHTP